MWRFLWRLTIKERRIVKPYYNGIKSPKLEGIEGNSKEEPSTMEVESSPSPNLHLLDLFLQSLLFRFLSAIIVIPISDWGNSLDWVQGASAVLGFFAAVCSLPFDYVNTQIQKMQPDATGKYPDSRRP
ncbi:hypothetical protein GIB67_028684, partial [Kingdonia uniflora]